MSKLRDRIALNDNSGKDQIQTRLEEFTKLLSDISIKATTLRIDFKQWFSSNEKNWNDSQWNEMNTNLDELNKFLSNIENADENFDSVMKALNETWDTWDSLGAADEDIAN